MSDEHFLKDGLTRPRAVRSPGPGIIRLRRTAKPGECPFCGDPIRASIARPSVTCGDPICMTAYTRYYARSRRKMLQVIRWSAAVTETASGVVARLAGLLP